MLVIGSADQHADLEYLNPFKWHIFKRITYFNSCSTKKRYSKRLHLWKSYKIMARIVGLTWYPVSISPLMSVRCWHNHFRLRGPTVRPTICSLQCLSRPKKAGLAVMLLASSKRGKDPPFGQGNLRTETISFSTGNCTHMDFKLSQGVFRGYHVLFRLLQSCNLCVCVGMCI